MKQALFAMVFALVTLSMVASAQDAQDESVRFAPCTSSAMIKETITGYLSVNYKLGAKAGQHMIVVLKTDNGSNYFNIFVPGKGPGDEAISLVLSKAVATKARWRLMGSIRCRSISCGMQQGETRRRITPWKSG